ncbi:Putative N2,N2-dimethylguanosine tRNA methyltransferase [Plasmopara halstedii]|uniref:Putative N2,N2-dimethylguanosine tRNA methyltransferase n=1 Tax=Plasmopara halstedii TaxID=4781 RepID=A0A0P1AEI0_PLAHL|nr:Putative N2,N2-dimethylguanosine tRNA methyltransferase [Plasmopara halstedii]CEG39061.1 Putative N2,N2-dimethylguanosine tRNA methyltransferase [Plasmopara halstedii]|eukprot:XP_024575430.1 Putative N2,N2-dimethylguanosine tRNA methyltransferase [Plasmopara halstedii]
MENNGKLRIFRFVHCNKTTYNAHNGKSLIDAAVAPKRQCVDKPSVIQVRLAEHICDLDEAKTTNDNYYGLFVWPSALLLSQFISTESRWLCRDKTILELGCGIGLPSILSGLCGAARIYLTDRIDASDIQRNADTNIKLNGLEDRAQYLPLSWGDMHVSEEIISVFQTIQVVLAADCFYQSEEFEKVIATVALILRCSASLTCSFYFSYHLRSINRSIAFLLSRWKLIAQSIDKNAYVNDLIKIGDYPAKDFDSIYLYEVKRAIE